MTQTQTEDLNYQPLAPETINPGVLVSFDYAYQGKRAIDIQIRQPEFTAVCPMTGLPDFGCITVAYQPAKRIIELKSLKYYLLQYRNVGIFYEHVVNRILDDLVNVVSPVWMEVAGDFTARGGLTTSVIAAYGEKNGLHANL